MPGLFITFEGGEGSGKTTQIALLEKAFSAAAVSCIRTREPGGSPGAEKIRELLVTGAADRWDADTETVLFCTARLDHVNRLIRPSLTEGKAVLCDRFADSTYVYQGIGKGVPEQRIDELHRVLVGDFAPDLTIILDIDPEVGLGRAASRQGREHRFESMSVEFHRKVREGFLSRAKKYSARCVLVNAEDDVGVIHHSIIHLVNERFGLRLVANG